MKLPTARNRNMRARRSVPNQFLKTSMIWHDSDRVNVTPIPIGAVEHNFVRPVPLSDED